MESISEEMYPALFPNKLTIKATRVRKLTGLTRSLHLGSQDAMTPLTTACLSVPEGHGVHVQIPFLSMVRSRSG